MHIVSRVRALSVTLALALLVAASVYASHSSVSGSVTVFRGTTDVSFHEGSAACTGTTCGILIAVGKRDYNRFVRWCGDADADITIPANTTGAAGLSCVGSSSWHIETFATVNGGVHSSDVAVHIVVTP
jgi:hypothetical protein